MRRKLRLHGMSCKNCVTHVNRTLQSLETTNLQVCVGAQSMLVNTGGTSALIQQAIDGAGHTILGLD